MIEPILKGQALLDNIQAARPQSDEICIWWLGQSGYAMKTLSSLFYVDLYLSEHLTHKYELTEKPHIRMTEAPLHGSEITNATSVFASHKHSDHLDPGTLPDLFAASPDAHLILPMPVVDHAVAMGNHFAALDEVIAKAEKHPGQTIEKSVGCRQDHQGTCGSIDKRRRRWSKDTGDCGRTGCREPC